MALFALHKANLKIAEVDNPFAHARTVMQRAMWGHYSGMSIQFDERNFEELWPEGSDLSGSDLDYYYRTRGLDLAAFAGLDGRPRDGTQAELFELEDYFVALERECGSVAKTIVVNLISPCGQCGKRILDEAKRKQLMQHRLKSASRAARRSQPRGVQNEIRLSQRVVRNALGLSASEWNRNMTKIKEFTRSWLAQ